MQTKKYEGILGGPGGFDGYAGLILGQSYTGEEKDVPSEPTEEGAEPTVTKRVVIELPNGRTTSITPEQWRSWFK